MRMALIGATGMIGRRILAEALARGHRVTAVVRDPARLPVQHERLEVAVGDIFDRDGLAAILAGHEVVISSYGPQVGTGREEELLEATRSLIAAAKKAGVARLLAVGGAGSLTVAPGVQLMDLPEFPPIALPIAQAHKDALKIYRQEQELDWAVLSPAADIRPGERTGQYRLGREELVRDAQGQSRISAEDFAVALLDEVENPRHHRQRFTVGY